MKRIFKPNLLLILSITLVVASCGKSSKSSNVSSTTGWQINDRNGGFQYNTQFQEQETAPGLVFIEGGTFTMGRVQDDVMHDWNNSPTQQHIQSFYMDETEVTNKSYLEYLDYLKRVFPVEEFPEVYKSALPDTLAWRNRLGYSKMMTEYYLRHPAYGEYPVVGVSWIQATEFAKWRTNMVTEMTLRNSGYLSRDSKNTSTAEGNFDKDTYVNAPSQTFGGSEEVLNGGKRRQQTDADGNPINVYAKIESGLISPEYRLPTEAEWEYAALGLSELRSFNAYRGRKKYPWDGQYTRSGNRKNKGDQLANFKQGKGDYGGIAGWSDDGGDITSAVKSYAPNDYGLYDMAGNVAEWVADVYRPIVDGEYNDFNYFRGNVYTKNAINEDGTVKIITTDEIAFDTLSNGKVAIKTLPGQVANVPVGDEETYLRTNFDTSDNRNFRDGDLSSSRDFDMLNEEEIAASGKSITNQMYNSPVHTITRDDNGNIVQKESMDTSNARTSLINDEVRVYKGGSWKDRAYWLDPSQRRYYPQDMATDYIGFRCAMSRVGDKSKNARKQRN